MQPMIVTAAVILDGRNVLITQREKGSNQGLKWEFPGGKLEKGEDPEECIYREIKEELTIEIEVKDIFQVVMHRYSDRTILLLAYWCNHIGGEIVPVGCRDFSWVPLEKLMDYELAPADIPIARKLQRVYLDSR